MQRLPNKIRQGWWNVIWDRNPMLWYTRDHILPSTSAFVSASLTERILLKRRFAIEYLSDVILYLSRMLIKCWNIEFYAHNTSGGVLCLGWNSNAEAGWNWNAARHKPSNTTTPPLHAWMTSAPRGATTCVWSNPYGQPSLTANPHGHRNHATAAVIKRKHARKEGHDFHIFSNWSVKGCSVFEFVFLQGDQRAMSSIEFVRFVGVYVCFCSSAFLSLLGTWELETTLGDKTTLSAKASLRYHCDARIQY